MSEAESTPRWEQRFANLQRAYGHLQEAAMRVVADPGDEIMTLAFVKAYEMCFELAWKTIKDYLEEGGTKVNSPREVIRSAFQWNLIDDGEMWLQALNDRNLTAHTYNQEVAQEVEYSITQTYMSMIGRMIERFKQL